jgi:Protein of unknown function (DUF3467)
MLGNTRWFLNIKDRGSIYHLKILFIKSPNLGLFVFIFVKKIHMSSLPEQPNQINIEISEEVSEGEYANLAIITHSHAEFVIDFVNVMPGTPKSKVKSRIILTPFHAKRFMKAMVENVKKFETANGTIQDMEAVEIPFNFGGPTAQA